MTTKLRVYWHPQVPCTPFVVPVENLVEAKLLLNTLADYDLFQLSHRIKPDYSNAGGLEQLDSDGDWIEWESADGYSIEQYTLDELRKSWKQLMGIRT